MQSFKHIALFTKNNVIQLGRKWLSLPLLLLFPILLIGLIAIMIISTIDNSNQDTIHVGLVDLDQSEETEIIVELLEESSELGDFVEMSKIDEETAIAKIDNNQLSSYIIFPENFFQKMMEGERSQLSIIGNAKQPLESELINELVGTITRHIRGSQANILTINHYAKQLDMNADDRNDLLFEQFVDYFLYVLGGERVLDEDQVINNATSSPVLYFSLAGWFTLVTIWLFIIYISLHQENSRNMKQRMKLYGVTELQQAIASGIVVLLMTGVLASASFAIFQHFFETMTIVQENYVRIGLLLLFHSIVFLQCLTLLDWLLPSQKLTLLVQTLFTGLTILFSGAIIPKLYFPSYMEEYLTYSFSHQAFHWIEQIVLNGRFYAAFQPIAITAILGLLILMFCSVWKERVYK